LERSHQDFFSLGPRYLRYGGRGLLGMARSARRVGTRQRHAGKGTRVMGTAVGALMEQVEHAARGALSCIWAVQESWLIAVAVPYVVALVPAGRAPAARRTRVHQREVVVTCSHGRTGRAASARRLRRALRRRIGTLSARFRIAVLCCSTGGALLAARGHGHRRWGCWRLRREEVGVGRLHLNTAEPTSDGCRCPRTHDEGWSRSAQLAVEDSWEQRAEEECTAEHEQPWARFVSAPPRKVVASDGQHQRQDPRCGSACEPPRDCGPSVHMISVIPLVLLCQPANAVHHRDGRVSVPAGEASRSWGG
jgi:hypothetical protein